MRDIFEPSHESAKSIDLAFQSEVLKRQGRPPGEWAKAERG